MRILLRRTLWFLLIFERIPINDIDGMNPRIIPLPIFPGFGKMTVTVSTKSQLSIFEETSNLQTPYSSGEIDLAHER